MKIQYASDLHLEFYERIKTWEPVLVPTAPVLILAGDIGNPSKALLGQFLRHCSEHWEQVYYVAGNHEFYNRERPYKPETVEMRIAQLKQLCVDTGVVFLDRTKVDLDEDTVLLGAILWSRPTHAAFLQMNDMERIWMTDKLKMTMEDMYAMNDVDKTWLQQQIAIAATANKKIIVVTHHPPTDAVIIDKYKDEENSGFSNFDMNDIVAQTKIWICGHTHGCNTVTLGQCTICTNTLGYPGEGVDGYSMTATCGI